jgi:hypothetical protein
MSEAGSRWPNREISGGPRGYVLSASEGRGPWDLQMEDVLGSSSSTRWRGRGETSSGSFREGWETSKNEASDRGRLWSSHRIRTRPTTSKRVVPRTSGHRSGNRMRGAGSQLADAASTASSLEVGDAGDGYSTLSWTVQCQSLRSRVGGRTEQVAMGETARAASSRVGDPADAHDN